MKLVLPVVLTLGLSGPVDVVVASQSPPSAAAAVTPSWAADEWLPSDARIALELDTPMSDRLAVFIGPTDVTDLLRRAGSRLIYRPELLPLPPGSSEVVVWSAGPAGWRELGRFPIKVLTRSNLEQSERSLRLDLEGLLDVDSGGTAPPPEEQRASLQLDLRQQLARRGWAFQIGSNVIGVSEVEQALRFGQHGPDADRIDLSSWDAALSRGRFELGFGHLSFGDSRLLVQGFASRGARMRLPLGPVVELAVAAMNGSSIVGWDNLLGLSRSAHQITAATLTMEAAPSRPGALRFELTALDGSVLPESGFNQGDVTDREQSEGWSLRVLAAPTSRLRLDAAWAASDFTNPFDPLLAQGEAVVAVEPERREARSIDLSWAIVQRQGADGRPLELALDLAHRRTDPLYRTVAAYVQSDLAENSGQLRLSWGGLSSQLSHSRLRDNLDDLPSVLTTRTERSAWAFQIPLAELGRSASTWWPALTLSGERTHQLADGIPVDGGFSASHVPDQVSLAHQLGLQWSGASWTLTASASSSDQDNRQPGRENADFEHRGGGLSVFTSPVAWLDLGLDLRRERQHNLEQGETTTIDTASLIWTVRLPRRHTLSGNLSWTDSETDPGLRSSRDLGGDLQWSWTFERRRREHGIAARLYLGASYRDARAEDFLFEVFDHSDGWKVTAGTSVSLH